MITIFVKILFSLISIYSFIYTCSFVNYEIKKNSNIVGSIFILLFTTASIILSNIIFWINKI